MTPRKPTNIKWQLRQLCDMSVGERLSHKVWFGISLWEDTAHCHQDLRDAIYEVISGIK